MKCSTAQEQINSLVGGEETGWRSWQAARHCAHCSTCRMRREQAAQIAPRLRDLASLPTPPHVRANVFAQLPATSAQANAAQNMQVSLGLEPGAKRRRVVGRLVRSGCLIAAGCVMALMAAPRILPGFPNVFVAGGVKMHVMQAQRDFERDFGSIVPPARLLAQCQTLRDLWKPWAEAHQSSLRQMLRADKQDSAAMIRVFEELPPLLPDTGKGLTNQLLQSDGLKFSWQPAAKLQMTFRYNPQSPRNSATDAFPVRSEAGYSVAYDNDKEGSKLNRVGMENRTQYEKQALHDFQARYVRFHDIELCRSLAFSMTQYSLWASGRITEMTRSGSVPVVREISPPYEELTR